MVEALRFSGGVGDCGEAQPSSRRRAEHVQHDPGSAGVIEAQMAPGQPGKRSCVHRPDGNVEVIGGHVVLGRAICGDVRR